MTASLEPCAGYVLRVHGAGGRLGDPYCWCVFVEADGDTAVLKGALEAPSGDARRAGQEALRRAGFKRHVECVKGRERGTEL